MGVLISLNEFADLINAVLRSDRDVYIGVGGSTGEGKSVFNIQLMKAYYKLKGEYFNFDNMTYSRDELKVWILGKNPHKNDYTGRLPEYSGIMADELFKMFYKRNWHNAEQIDAVALLNMVRDRHLLITGNCPNIWDLDAGFLSRLRFYVYVYKRGCAWIFQPENNPFSKDMWNVAYNYRLVKEARNPYKSPNFLGEIRYFDLSPEEKITYLEIRNKKREMAFLKSADPVKMSDRNRLLEWQRNILMYYIKSNALLTQKEIGNICGLTEAYVKEKTIMQPNKPNFALNPKDFDTEAEPDAETP